MCFFSTKKRVSIATLHRVDTEGAANSLGNVVVGVVAQSATLPEPSLVLQTPSVSHVCSCWGYCDDRLHLARLCQASAAHPCNNNNTCVTRQHSAETGKNARSLTLKVLVATIDAQWEGMGDVGSARYEPALLPPCPTIRVLSYSN